MSLDDLLRVRCEPELRERLEQLAVRRRVKVAQLARQIMWDYIEAQEASISHLNDAPLPPSAPVTYKGGGGRTRARGRGRITQAP